MIMISLFAELTIFRFANAKDAAIGSASAGARTGLCVTLDPVQCVQGLRSMLVLFLWFQRPLVCSRIQDPAVSCDEYS